MLPKDFCRVRNHTVQQQKSTYKME